MTDDIVTRLRTWSESLYPMEYGACMEHAADEIERLQNELHLVRSMRNRQDTVIHKMRMLALDIMDQVHNGGDND